VAERLTGRGFEVRTEAHNSGLPLNAPMIVKRQIELEQKFS